MVDPWSRRRFLAFGTSAAAALGLGALNGCATITGGRPITIARETLPYGFEPMQKGDLRGPVEDTPRPVVVLLHGGYWRIGFDRDSMTALADDLARRGYATWNVDYRRVGEPGGGWPGTLIDVAAAVDAIAALAPTKNLDATRVAVLGHSAGAQLAFWAAARAGMPAGAPGAAPTVKPRAAVSLSGVLDLRAALTEVIDDGGELAAATRDLLGGDVGAVPDRYDLASPAARIPLALPQLLLHGEADTKVPVSQSRSYSDNAAARGDEVSFVEVPGADHFDVISIAKAWWDEVVGWLPKVLGDPTT